MSNVAVSIGGRNYALACAPGEEKHIEMLGRMIDDKLQGVANPSGQSEARTLLFAALLLADELYELQSGGSSAPADDGPSAETLERLADKLEGLAARLESAG